MKPGQLLWDGYLKAHTSSTPYDKCMVSNQNTNHYCSFLEIIYRASDIHHSSQVENLFHSTCGKSGMNIVSWLCDYNNVLLETSNTTHYNICCTHFDVDMCIF